MRSRHSVLASIVMGAALVTAAALAGCDGGQPSSSPVVPSTVRAPSNTGAMVTGVVTSLATGAPSSGTATVAGSSVTAIVDGAGQFTLTGLPAGDLQLLVSVAAGTATIEVSGLAEREQRELRIALDSDGGLLAQERNGDLDQDRIRLSADIYDVSGSCPQLRFMGAGIPIQTSPATEFTGGTCGDLMPGAGVELKAVRAKNGEAVAQHVRIRERAQSGGNEGEGNQVRVRAQVRSLTGNCPVLSMELNGTRVMTSAQTQYTGGTCEQVRNGVDVEAQGPPDAGGNGKGAITATRLRLFGLSPSGLGTCRNCHQD